MKIFRAIKHKLALALLASVAVFQAATGQINTEQVMTIGRNALYFEDYVLSIQYFNQAIQSSPFLAEPYLMRAIAKISLEDYKGAADDATLCIDRNPFIADAYQLRGVARQNMRDFNGAISDYKEGLKIMPDNKTFLLYMGICQTEVKQYAAADSTFGRLLQVDPKSDKAYLGMAQLNIERADTTKALECLDKSLAINKKEAQPYVMRAQIEIVSSKYKNLKAAEADMDSAIVLEPHYAGYFINRAYIKYHLDDYFGAMSDYDYAVGLDPSNVTAHFNRGLLLTEVGENNKAIDDFDFVLEKEPDNFMALYNRAILYAKTGQFKKSLADYDKVLKKYPAFEAGYMARGEIKRRMGDKAGSEKDFDYAVSIFKRKKTHVSTFDPAKVEAQAAKKKADEEEKRLADNEPETEDEIMKKFNELLTVDAGSKIKPEYNSKTRGHVQNNNIDIEPEAMFDLTYYGDDKKTLSGNRTSYVKEIADVNDAHALPMQLTLSNDGLHLTTGQISDRFASIKQYTDVIEKGSARSIDYFGRALDYLMVKDAAAAVADCDIAISKSPRFALAYFLRANAYYMQYLLSLNGNADRAQRSVSSALSGKSVLSNDINQELVAKENVRILGLVQADLDTVARLSPKNAFAHFNRGNVFLLKQDFTSAISCYTTAIELKPDFGEAYYNRGLMFLRLGNRERGVADMSKAGELGILPSYNVLKRMTSTR